VSTVLLKIGSAIITRNNRLNIPWIRKKVKELSDLSKLGYKFILTTSGSVVAGMEIEKITVRPKDTFRIQLLSGKGQIRLSKIYKDSFKRHNIHVAQILLTHHNFATPAEKKNIKEVIYAYLEEGTIPIINTNDIITQEEIMEKSHIKFSDNDELAALVAVNLKIDLLLILTDVEGLYKEDPKTKGQTQLIEKITRYTKNIEMMATKEGSTLGKGGMLSKVRAAHTVNRKGIPAIIAHGRHSLEDILRHKVKFTYFFPSKIISEDTIFLK